MIDKIAKIKQKLNPPFLNFYFVFLSIFENSISH